MIKTLNTLLITLFFISICSWGNTIVLEGQGKHVDSFSIEHNHSFVDDVLARSLNKTVNTPRIKRIKCVTQQIVGKHIELGSSLFLLRKIHTHGYRQTDERADLLEALQLHRFHLF